MKKEGKKERMKEGEKKTQYYLTFQSTCRHIQMQYTHTEFCKKSVGYSQDKSAIIAPVGMSRRIYYCCESLYQKASRITDCISSMITGIVNFNALRARIHGRRLKFNINSAISKSCVSDIWDLQQ